MKVDKEDIKKSINMAERNKKIIISNKKILCDFYKIMNNKKYILNPIYGK